MAALATSLISPGGTGSNDDGKPGIV